MTCRNCVWWKTSSLQSAIRLACLLLLLATPSIAQDTVGTKPKEIEDSLELSVVQAPIVNVTKRQKRVLLWSAEIGSSAGPITVNSGMVFVGTNNSRDSGSDVDRAQLMCFQDIDGLLIWENKHDRLPSRVHDLPTQAIKSQVTVDGNKAFYISNRGELVCLSLDVERGFPIGGVAERPQAKTDWTLDMVSQLGVFKRDAGDIGNPISSPLVMDQMVYCLTGQGSMSGYEYLSKGQPILTAPSFLAVNKRTGVEAWSSAVLGDGLMIGQWATPVAVQVKGVTQVIFPGGDGVLYGFHPLTGKREWSLDCNSPARSQWSSGKRGTRCFFKSRPTVVKNILYAALGQDLETPANFAAPVVAVDLSPIGEFDAPSLLWSFENENVGQISGEVRFEDDRVYSVSQSGKLVVLNAKTGELLWLNRIGESSAMLGAPCLQNQRILVNTDSELLVFTMTDRPQCVVRYRFPERIENSPVFHNGIVYVTTCGHLWALRVDGTVSKKTL